MSGEQARRSGGAGRCSGGPAVQWAVAVAAPIAVALLLIPGRNHLDSADDALVLVVVTVAIASTGAGSGPSWRPSWPRRRSTSS